MPEATPVIVGDTVFFYEGGNAGDAPFAGIVTEVFGAQPYPMLTVCIRQSGNWFDKTRVSHRDSPALKANPTMALKLGMWDHRPVIKPPVVIQHTPAVPENDFPPVQAVKPGKSAKDVSDPKAAASLI